MKTYEFVFVVGFTKHAMYIDGMTEGSARAEFWRQMGDLKATILKVKELTSERAS